MKTVVKQENEKLDARRDCVENFREMWPRPRGLTLVYLAFLCLYCIFVFYVWRRGAPLVWPFFVCERPNLNLPVEVDEKCLALNSPDTPCVQYELAQDGACVERDTDGDECGFPHDGKDPCEQVAYCAGGECMPPFCRSCVGNDTSRCGEVVVFDIGYFSVLSDWQSRCVAGQCHYTAKSELEMNFEGLRIAGKLQLVDHENMRNTRVKFGSCEVRFVWDHAVFQCSLSCDCFGYGEDGL